MRAELGPRTSQDKACTVGGPGKPSDLVRPIEPHGIVLNRPDLLQIFREKFSKMRSAAALHQADWPAVRLEEADDSYRRSVMRVRENNRDFVAWMRATLQTV